MNRLSRSLQALLLLNVARRQYSVASGKDRRTWRKTVKLLEAALEQNDADARAKSDVRQLPLFGHEPQARAS